MSGGALPETGDRPISALEALVGNTLDNLRTFRSGWLAPVLLGVIMLFDSWDSIAIAYVMPLLAKDWALNPAVMGALISSGYIGQFIGAITLGALAERFGRMPVFIVAAVVMGLFALACAITQTPGVMMALRFVQGIAIGGALPVSIAYINELAPTKTRGRYFTFFQWLSMSGYTVASISSNFVLPTLGWHWMLGLGAIPLALIPIVLFTLPESPRWLARTGRTSRIPGAIAKLGGSLSAEEIALCDAEAKAAPPPTVPISRLFNERYRTRTITLLTIWFFAAFVNFGLTTWAPTILTSVYHLPLKSALRFSATSSSLFLVGMALIGAVMDRFGRRPFAIAGCFLASIALATLATVHFQSISTMAIVLVSGMVTISLAVFIQWPFSAESYPTEVRAVGMGVCSSMARAASMLTPLFVGVVLSTGAPVTLIYGTFSVLALGVALLWIFATRETAQTKLDEI